MAIKPKKNRPGYKRCAYCGAEIANSQYRRHVEQKHLAATLAGRSSAQPADEVQPPEMVAVSSSADDALIDQRRALEKLAERELWLDGEIAKLQALTDERVAIKRRRAMMERTLALWEGEPAGEAAQTQPSAIAKASGQ